MFVRTQDGISLHVQQLGGGPPVVMLHGLITANLASWYFGVAPRLTQDYRVILYDHRGHGRSDQARAGYSVDAMAEDLNCVLHELVREPAHLVGHSYGGCIALRFAANNPHRVRSLCVIEAPLPPVGSGTIERVSSASTDTLAGVAAARRLDRAVRRGKRLIDNLQFLVRESSLLADMRAEQDIPDATLEKITAPTLAIYGLGSDCRAAGRRIARCIPSATHVEIEGGHELPVENPAVVADLLVTFLKSIAHANSVQCKEKVALA